MRKYRTIGLGLLVLLAPAAAWALLQSKSQAPADLGLLSSVMKLIQSDFVEEASSPKLIAGALDGMLHSLDPYSQFLDEEDYQDLQNANIGRIGGVGFEFSLKDGEMVIIAPLDGSPAARGGLKSGDHVLKIDEKSTHDMKLSDATHALRGEPGTRVRLTILRDKERRVFDINLERAKIQIPAVKEARLEAPGIAYVRISAFQQETAQELRTVLGKLKNEGADRLILDLRNNPGGPLESAIRTAELFIAAGKTIVTTRGRNQSKNSLRASKAQSVFEFKKIVVLVNRGSASDAEILAGALKDHGLATLIGSKTFGKGSIQSVIPIGNGSAIRMTTSRYYTPSGAVIHEKGIEPDIRVDEEKKASADRVLAKALEFLRTNL